LPDATKLKVQIELPSRQGDKPITIQHSVP